MFRVQIQVPELHTLKHNSIAIAVTPFDTQL